MPITGLTGSRTESRGKVEIAVFKGDRKTEKRPGSDLNDKLRITTSNAIANNVLKDKFACNLTPNQNGDFFVEKLNVYLPYSTTDRVFPTAMKAFDASGLKLVCDRHTITEELQLTKDAKGNVWRGMKSSGHPCPLRDNPEVWVCPNECSKNGELFFFIRELFDQDHMILGRITCHGFEDITRLSEKLAHWESVFSDLSRSPFPSPQTRHCIPFVIQRIQVNIKRPILLGKEQNYARTEKKADGTTWALDIYPDPEWMKFFNLFQQYKLAQEMGIKPSRKAIAQLAGVDSNLFEAEIIEEPKALPPAMSRDELMTAISKAIALLGWTESEAKQYLKENFNGKVSRQQLSDEELQAFHDQLTTGDDF